MKLYENCSKSLNAVFKKKKNHFFAAIFYFLKIEMARDSFSGYLAFDYQAVVLVTFFFISCCSARQAWGDSFFAEVVSGRFPEQWKV